MSINRRNNLKLGFETEDLVRSFSYFLSGGISNLKAPLLGSLYC